MNILTAASKLVLINTIFTYRTSVINKNISCFEYSKCCCLQWSMRLAIST